MRKGVTIELDKPRTLRYGVNALAMIEDLTGKPISKMDMNCIGVKDLRSIVFAGLAHEDKSLTLEDIGNYIDEYSNMDDIIDKVGQAFTLAFAAADKNPNKTVANST